MQQVSSDVFDGIVGIYFVCFMTFNILSYPFSSSLLFYKKISFNFPMSFFTFLFIFVFLILFLFK